MEAKQELGFGGIGSRRAVEITVLGGLGQVTFREGTGAPKERAGVWSQIRPRILGIQFRCLFSFHQGCALKGYAPATPRCSAPPLQRGNLRLWGEDLPQFVL